jgi:hypothetical protein
MNQVNPVARICRFAVLLMIGMWAGRIAPSAMDACNNNMICEPNQGETALR